MNPCLAHVGFAFFYFTFTVTSNARPGQPQIWDYLCVFSGLHTGIRCEDGWNLNEHNYKRRWETDVTARSQHSLLDQNFKHIVVKRAALMFHTNENLNNSDVLYVNLRGKQVKYKLSFDEYLYLALLLSSVSGSKNTIFKNRVSCCFFSSSATLAKEKCMQEDESG